MNWLALVVAWGVYALPIRASYVESDSWTEDLHPVLSDPVNLVESAVAKPGSPQEAAAMKLLSVQLDAVKPIVDLSKSDDDFVMLFTIFNPSNTSIKLLMRDTPLEGMQSKLFMIKSPSGKMMEYRGKDLKRKATPSEDEYRVIRPKQSISRRVRVSRRYQLDGDGLYYIRVRQPRDGHMTYSDVMRTMTKVFVRGTRAHEERNAEREQHRRDRARELELVQTGIKSSVKTMGCTAQQAKELTKWHKDANSKIATALKCTKKNGCRSAIETWFGKRTSQADFNARVKAQFKTMKKKLSQTTYWCQSAKTKEKMQQSCKGGSTYAYVYPVDTTQQVYICDFTFKEPDYAEKVQTVIHELSHFNHIGGTNDNAYGEKNCIQLAQKDFKRAIKTADNVGYFGKYVDLCFKNAPSGFKAKPPPRVDCEDQFSNCGQLASNCGGRLQNGKAVADACCRSCSRLDPSSYKCSRGAKFPKFMNSKASAQKQGSKQDKVSNCNELVSDYGCDACCVPSTNGKVKTVCAKTCGKK